MTSMYKLVLEMSFIRKKELSIAGNIVELQRQIMQLSELIISRFSISAFGIV